MSTPTDQERYIELYFDLEKVNTKLSGITKLVHDALEDITHIYITENKLAEEGKKIPVRPPHDIATRAALSAGVAMLVPQLKQLFFTIGLGQRTCEILAPSLQTSPTPN